MSLFFTVVDCLISEAERKKRTNQAGGRGEGGGEEMFREGGGGRDKGSETRQQDFKASKGVTLIHFNCFGKIIIELLAISR